VARLAAEAGVGSTPTRKQLERVRRLVRRRVAAAAHGHMDAGTPLVLGGGSARAVARVIQATNGERGAPLHGASVGASDVDALAERLTSTSLDERLRMPGVSQRRALDLPVAATVVAAALDVLGASNVTMSEWGLRHGVVLDAVSSRRTAGIGK
jgi:exopolyphosphatase/guanosine-5'-triphosphate,3'-diphosphate pyrophosphatase